MEAPDVESLNGGTVKSSRNQSRQAAYVTRHCLANPGKSKHIKLDQGEKERAAPQNEEGKTSVGSV
jgi:hypothetical protein